MGPHAHDRAELLLHQLDGLRVFDWNVDSVAAKRGLETPAAQGLLLLLFELLEELFGSLSLLIRETGGPELGGDRGRRGKLRLQLAPSAELRIENENDSVSFGREPAAYIGRLIFKLSLYRLNVKVQLLSFPGGRWGRLLLFPRLGDLTEWN